MQLELITIPVETEVIQLAANCSSWKVVIPKLIVAVSRLVIPGHNASAWVTILRLDIKHESMQSTSNDIVRPCWWVARTWHGRITCGWHWRIAWSWRRVCWSWTCSMQLHRTRKARLNKNLHITTNYHKELAP